MPGPDIPVRVTRGALITHQYTSAPPCCRTSQYRRIFIALSVSLWNDVGNSVFDGVGLAGFKSRANDFYRPSCSQPFCLLLNYPKFLFFHSVGWYFRAGVFGLIGYYSFFPSLAVPINVFNNNNCLRLATSS